MSLQASLQLALTALARSGDGLLQSELPGADSFDIAGTLLRIGLANWNKARLVLTGTGWWMLKPHWPTLAPSLESHLRALAEAIYGLNESPDTSVSMQHVSTRAGLDNTEDAKRA